MNFPLTLLFTLLFVSFSHLILHSSLAMEKLEGFFNSLSLSECDSICHLKLLVSFSFSFFQIPEIPKWNHQILKSRSVQEVAYLIFYSHLSKWNHQSFKYSLFFLYSFWWIFSHLQIKAIEFKGNTCMKYIQGRILSVIPFLHKSGKQGFGEVHKFFRFIISVN
jgi:hypothetical protein